MTTDLSTASLYRMTYGGIVVKTTVRDVLSTNRLGILPDALRGEMMARDSVYVVQLPGRKAMTSLPVRLEKNPGKALDEARATLRRR